MTDTGLIVGAGPVGLTAAIECARRGQAVRIIDKEPAPSPLSKAVGINVKSLELLEACGATERLIEAGVRVSRVHMYFDGRPLMTLDLSLFNHRFNFLLALAQNETERVLSGVLKEAGVSVERGVTLAEIQGDPGSSPLTARLTSDSGEAEVTAPWILGCDGNRSTVRDALGIEFAGRRYDEQWSLADVTLDWPLGEGDIHLFLHRSGAVLFVTPISKTRFRAISQTEDVLGLMPKDTRIQEIHWETRFRVALRQAATYQKGHCYLAGDAAHVHSPAGGRGMNLGMWDAVSFAERLATGRLDGYAAERHPIGAEILAFTDRLFRATGLTSASAQAVRNLIMRTVIARPFVQRRMVGRMLGAA